MVGREFAAAIIGCVLAVTTHDHTTNDFFGAVYCFKFWRKLSITTSTKLQWRLANISNLVTIKYTLYWEDTLGLGLSMN